MRHVLVVANETLVGSHLTSRLYELDQVEPLDVHVVVPMARHEDGSGFDRASTNLEAGIEAFKRGGIEATGEVGTTDPLSAVDHALSSRPAVNLILVSTLPLGRSKWVAMDLPHRIQRRHGLGVEHLIGAPVEATPDIQAPGRAVKVLLVEDNEHDIELATIALQNLDTDVDLLVTRTGAGAVQYLAEASPRPDLILADLKMPVMDGFTMLEQFASTLEIDTLHELNVVVVSSSSADSDRDHAHALGAHAYVVKDPDFDVFQATLASLVAEVAHPEPAK